MPWRNRVAGVMESWFGGLEEGNALTGILFGDEDPSGHLPVTFPLNERRTGPGQDNPWATYNNLDVEFEEEVNIGYRGYLAENLEPAFPFGHGLSYTDFQYDRLVTRELASGADSARVRLRLTNVGDASGTEVVQVYAGPLPFLEAPARKLVGFAKVDLDAGARTPVRIDIEREQLSYWDREPRTLDHPNRRGTHLRRQLRDGREARRQAGRSLSRALIRYCAGRPRSR